PTAARPTLSLHDALPISPRGCSVRGAGWSGRAVQRKRTRNKKAAGVRYFRMTAAPAAVRLGGKAVVNLSPRRTLRKRLGSVRIRSEEHTSELQSQSNLVC